MKLKLLILLLFTSLQIKAQTISGVSVENLNDQLIIHYSLLMQIPGTLVNVSALVLDSATNRKFEIPAEAGGLGNLAIGGSKTITWNYKKQTDSLSSHYSVELTVGKPFIGGQGAGNALRSILVPGWGNVYVRTSKSPGPVFITLAAYGLTGAGLITSLNAKTYYSDYMNNTDAAQMDILYNKAYNSSHTAYYLLGAGATLWAGDILYVALKGSSNTQHYRKYTAEKKTSFVPRFGIGTYGPALTLKF